MEEDVIGRIAENDIESGTRTVAVPQKNMRVGELPMEGGDFFIPEELQRVGAEVEPRQDIAQQIRADLLARTTSRPARL